MFDVCEKAPQVGQQGRAFGSLLLDLDGFEVVSAELVGGEWQLAVQTTATMVGCAGPLSQAASGPSLQRRAANLLTLDFSNQERSASARFRR
jgi:hypothetical protein